MDCETCFLFLNTGPFHTWSKWSELGEAKKFHLHRVNSLDVPTSESIRIMNHYNLLHIGDQKWYTHAITCIYWHIAATTTWWPSATKQQKKNRKSFDAVKTTCRFPRRLRKRHESSLVVSDVHCASECSLQNAKSAMFESSQDVNTGKVADASLILVFKKGGEQWANK